ncbi:MAG: LamG domain-containing protein [Candidatus Moduliflexus flocculans]|nr:LamG domain-containing protein [Candidatus Moduliflexus flocculans]
MTLEAWVVLGAYPWSDAGIVHQSSGEPVGREEYKHGYRDPYTYRPWKMDGYFLGVDPYGRPIFKVNGRQVGGGVLEAAETVRREDSLPTYRWTHLAATYGNGEMCLYVNGRLAATAAATGPVVLPDRDVLVGLNGDPQRVSDPVSHSKYAVANNLPLVYGIEGLIDEVMIYDRALTAAEIGRSFQASCPPEAELSRPDLEKRILPGGGDGRPAPRFGATCRDFEVSTSCGTTSGGPTRTATSSSASTRCRAAWCSGRGPNFGSGWVTENNKWMSDQSWEIGGPHGCAEHMADKRGRFDHVRLIENTPARVVVHWRYASIDVGYVFSGTDIWADEYYTIYPDGVGVRFVDMPDEDWQDTQFLSQPGTTCLDNIDLTALSVANLRGDSADLTWALPNRVPGNPIKDACIKRINFRSKFKVFTIYKEGAEIETWGALEQSKHTPDPFAGPWNHWPVGLNPSDGRYAVADDRVTHAALGGARRIGKSVLYGFTDQAVTSLTALAKSWNRPRLSPARRDARAEATIRLSGPTCWPRRAGRSRSRSKARRTRRSSIRAS